MAQLAGVLHTYDEVVKREDLMDLMADVSADSNYLTSTLKTNPVSATLHEWAEYNIARPTTNSVTIEGDDNSYSDLTKPTRKNNIAQIIKETFAVSETDIVVNKMSPKDSYARELGWAMKRAKNKAEFAVLRGSKASGASGVARETEGIRNTVQTDGRYSARASGASLSEAIFNAIVLESWNTTDDYVFDLVLTTGSKKQDISKFTAGVTREIPADDKRLVRTISVYEADFGGRIEIRAHKDMQANEVLGIRKELCGVGYLRPWNHVANSVTGDSKKGHIVAELLAQVDTARAMVLQTNFNAT